MKLKLGGGISDFSTRTYLSHTFLRSAYTSTEAAKKIEQSSLHKWAEPHLSQHQDLVLSSIISSATFLEAMINELYSDAYDHRNNEELNKESYIAPLKKKTIQLMATYWQETDFGKQISVLNKFNMATLFADKTPIEKEGQLYENVRLVLRLRNTIVHYKPETIGNSQVHDLEKKLKSKFEINLLLPEDAGNSWWPYKALGAGCAEWTAQSAEQYANEFSARLGIVPVYQRVLRNKKAPR